MRACWATWSDGRSPTAEVSVTLTGGGGVPGGSRDRLRIGAPMSVIGTLNQSEHELERVKPSIDSSLVHFSELASVD